MNRHKILCSVFFGVILLTSVIVPSIGVAEAQSDQIRYSLVFVTTWKSCNILEENAMDYYASVTSQYLKKNGITAVGTLDCLSLELFNKMIRVGAYDNDDLIIVIPDFFHSYRYMNTMQAYGHHTYYNDRSDVIVSNSFAFFLEDKHATWTLSHELMHFVIAYKGWNWDYHEDYVHAIDRIYDETCIMYTINECPHVYDHVKSPFNDRLIPVMKPMPEPEKPVVKQPTVSKSKLPAWFKTDLRSDTSTSVINGDEFCLDFELQGSDGSKLRNVPVDIVYRFKTIGIDKTAISNEITGHDGRYYSCNNFNIEENLTPAKLEVYFIYYGNDEYRSVQSPTYLIWIIGNS